QSHSLQQQHIRIRFVISIVLICFISLITFLTMQKCNVWKYPPNSLIITENITTKPTFVEFNSLHPFKKAGVVE
ncbi:MAG: hypothetical protein IKO46_09470, partial [Salinivirgaceae bacterium]|nr:hypothetical protein [Salinivirgaceae bacterium]